MGATDCVGGTPKTVFRGSPILRFFGLRSDSRLGSIQSCKFLHLPPLGLIAPLLMEFLGRDGFFKKNLFFVPPLNWQTLPRAPLPTSAVVRVLFFAPA